MTAAVTVDPGDAEELLDLLELFCDWFDHDRSRVAASLDSFTGGSRPISEIRDDLRRLRDHLGGRR